MIVSKTNFFAKMYDYLWDNLPNNLCSLFWGSLFGLLMYIIMFTGKIWRFIFYDDISNASKDTIGTIINIFVFILFAGFFIETLYEPTIIVWVIITVIGIITGAIYLISLFFDSDTIVKRKLKAVKDKNCPLIEWK